MKRLVPLLVTLLVVSAGCTGVTGPADSRSTGTYDVPENATLPPGVAANGSVNVRTLLDANDEQLRTHGFELAVAFNSTGDYASTIERHARATPGFARYRSHVTVVRNGARDVQRVWVNETMPDALVNETTANGATYTTRTVGDTPSSRAMATKPYLGMHRLQGLLGQADFEITGSTVTDGTRQYTLVGTNFTEESGGSVQNATLALTVTADGAILHMSERGTLTSGGTFAFDYRATLGVETVQRPDWVASVPADVRANATASAD